MTDAALNATENADIEDGSDDGSDIFMPGGITMKSTEISSESSDQKDNEDTSVPNDLNGVDDVNMSIDEKPSAGEAATQETAVLTDETKVQEEEEKVDVKEEKVDVKEEKIEEKEEQEKSFESLSSPESCLEINIDGEESAFPSSNKEKIINNQRKEKEQEDLEERNIFMNSEIFEKENENKQQQQQQQQKEDENESAPKNEDDEHNMSDDFKIGLNQKSYEGDPFCPDKPRPYETTEKNIYLIDKLALYTSF